MEQHMFLCETCCSMQFLSSTSLVTSFLAHTPVCSCPDVNPIQTSKCATGERIKYLLRSESPPPASAVHLGFLCLRCSIVKVHNACKVWRLWKPTTDRLILSFLSFSTRGIFLVRWSAFGQRCPRSAFDCVRHRFLGSSLVKCGSGILEYSGVLFRQRVDLSFVFWIPELIRCISSLWCIFVAVGGIILPLIVLHCFCLCLFFVRKFSQSYEMTRPAGCSCESYQRYVLDSDSWIGCTLELLLHCLGNIFLYHGIGSGTFYFVYRL